MDVSETDKTSNLGTSTLEGFEFELADEDILSYGRYNLNSSLLENVLTRFKKFTPVQRKAIPAILSGRDVLIKSQTGSGKTLATLIPLLSLLLENGASYNEFDLKLLILVPSNDLMHQVESILKILLQKCSLSFKSVNNVNDKLANVVVTKPSIAVDILKDQEILYLVIDESDLLFEFGYKNDMFKLIYFLRSYSQFKKFQTVLLSATLIPEIKNIANLLLYKPVYIDIPFTQKSGNVNEYYIVIDEDNKLLTLYVLLKLECIPCRSIIFVNSNKKAYHLYCFLRKLSLDINIVSKLLSPKLRHSILQNFNQGLIGCLIVIDDDNDQDMNLSRGIDFVNVKCVINFDEPKSLDIYKHRIGRTGRNSQEGSSLTFFTKNDHELLLKLTNNNENGSLKLNGHNKPDSKEIVNDDELKSDNDLTDDLEEADCEEVDRNEYEHQENDQMHEDLESDEEHNADNNYHHDNENNKSSLKRLSVDDNIFKSFKYRINDVLKTVTPKLVEIAQIQSVRHSAIEQEEFLKNVNENDVLLLKSVLKNDNQLLKPEKKHLIYVPKYLVDDKLQNVVDNIKYQIHPSSNTYEELRLKKLKMNKTYKNNIGKKNNLKRKRKFFRKKLPHFKKKKK